MFVGIIQIFLKPGVTSFTDKNDTRVRDILIHGAEEYSINWASEGLVAPGSGSLANYTEANVLSSSSFGGSWHGSHVAGTAAGNQFGAAFEANIWTIACVDRLMLDGQNRAMDLIILKFGIKINQLIPKLDSEIPQL